MLLSVATLFLAYIKMEVELNIITLIDKRQFDFHAQTTSFFTPELL